MNYRDNNGFFNEKTAIRDYYCQMDLKFPKTPLI